MDTVSQPRMAHTWCWPGWCARWYTLLLLSRFYKKIYPGIKHVISFKKERYADASWVGFRLIECLPLDSSTKNKLISMDHAIERLDMLNMIIQKIYKAEVKELMSSQQ